MFTWSLLYFLRICGERRWGFDAYEVYEDLSFNEMLEKQNDLDFSDCRTYQIQLTAYFFKSIPLCTTQYHIL